MRYRYLHTFRQLFIDNLNGDKYRTGKTTPEGLPDPSAFSTPQNREGIQVGTAIATLVRNYSAHQPAGTLNLRDLWGNGKLAQLERESRHEGEPQYSSSTPIDDLGDLFADRSHSTPYLTWPPLPDLFPISFSGVKTSRDSFLLDIDRDRLESRMKSYFDKTVTNEDFARFVPEAMEDGYMYDATGLRALLQERGFRAWEILRYHYRPFDVRWIYWEPETNLLRRKVKEYVSANVSQTAFVIAQRSRTGYKPPQVTREIVDLNATDGGANVYCHSTLGHGLLDDSAQRPNQTQSAATFMERISAPYGNLFFHAISVMHTPIYRSENAGALLADWPRIPLPATADLLAHSATIGRRLAELLDAESSVRLAAEWSFVAALKLPKNSELENALKLTAGWGYRGQGSTVMPGQGLSPERPWIAVERDKLATLATAQSLTVQNALALLGESCVDVHLNGETFWSAIPINVWNYTLGGYQVLKKWLSYRELPLLGRPLHSEEAAYFAQVVRRIGAILLLGPALDASYKAILPTATGVPKSGRSNVTNAV